MTPLRTALILNVATCFPFGALFILVLDPAARLLGFSSVVAVAVVGVTLLFVGPHLLMAWWCDRVRPIEGIYSSTGDLLWVTVALNLVAAELFLSNASSSVVSLYVAALLGVELVVQLYALSNECCLTPLDDRLPYYQSDLGTMVPFWKSGTPRVKKWLFLVTTSFMFALAVSPDSLACFILVVYLAAGLWLVKNIIGQRGLTRPRDVAHLIPWLLAFVYWALRLSSDLVDPQISFEMARFEGAYTVSLLIAVDLCLAFDPVDVWRCWHRGEPYRLDSMNTARTVTASSWSQSSRIQPTVFQRSMRRNSLLLIA